MKTSGQSPAASDSPAHGVEAVGLVGGGAAPLDVDHEVRLGGEIAAEADELIGAEVARLPLVPPREVDPVGALVARAHHSVSGTPAR